MSDYIRKRGAGGFTLVEILIVIMIIAILAGGIMIAFSQGSDNAEAAVIMSNLDAAKNALLAYSMEHRTRTSDRLGDFMSANSSTIISSLDKYMNSRISMTVDVDEDQLGKTRIGFIDFPASQKLIKALELKTAADKNSANYQLISNAGGTTCTIWLIVK
jgi:general secretion pathway protein G